MSRCCSHLCIIGGNDVLIILIFITIITFVIGFSVGLLVRKSSKSLSNELEETKKLLNEYQISISDHVHKTHEIIDNIYQQFSKLQKYSQEYSVKLNLDPSRQSLFQPKVYQDNKENYQLNNQQYSPKDYVSTKKR